MTTFVDTSALLALLDADESRHPAAVSTWEQLAARDTRLVTTNYVILETIAVAQRHLGVGAVRALVQDVLPAIDVVYVDAELHDAAISTLVTAGRRQLSLVDCVSFAVMRRDRLHEAFAFDRPFSELGYGLDASAR